MGGNADAEDCAHHPEWRCGEKQVVQAHKAEEAIKEAEDAMGHVNRRALDLLLPLARQNYPKAEVILGTMSRFGNKGRQAPGMAPTGYEDVSRDDATAAILFRRAADQGDFDGELNLALMYKEGAGGLPKDYSKQQLVP